MHEQDIELRRTLRRASTKARFGGFHSPLAAAVLRPSGTASSIPKYQRIRSTADGGFSATASNRELEHRGY